MRNLKILGLALVASLALSAMAASAASANTAVVTPGHHIEGLFGEDNPLNHALTGVAGVECTTAHYEGTATTSTITLKPTFELCHTTSGAPATVTVNGCDYQLTLGGPLNGMVAPVKHVQLVCPGSAQIEVHVYGNVNQTIHACTINIPGQTPTHQSSGWRHRNQRHSGWYPEPPLRPLPANTAIQPAPRRADSEPCGISPACEPAARQRDRAGDTVAL